MRTTVVDKDIIIIIVYATNTKAALDEYLKFSYELRKFVENKAAPAVY